MNGSFRPGSLAALSGFSVFGPAHLLWLTGLLAGGAALTLLHRRWGEKARRRLSLAVVWLAVLLVAAEYLRLIFLGRWTVRQLPLHLCELAPLVCLILACTGWDWAGQTAYCVCLPGAVSALLFPGWTNNSLWSFMNLQSFFLHQLLVLFILWEVMDGHIRPRLKAMWKAWAFLAVIIPPIYLFDVHFGVNYCFLIGDSPSSPLSALYRLFGAKGYLPAYGVLALAVTTAMYLPWEFKRRR